MDAAVIILPILLAASSLAGGTAKLVGASTMRADAWRFGFSYPAYQLIGLTEVAAAAGLVTGLFLWPVSAAAAAGVVCLMAGAVRTHRHANDPASKLTAPVVVAVLATATAVLQLATGS